jgi:hypothetical protein
MIGASVGSRTLSRGQRDAVIPCQSNFSNIIHVTLRWGWWGSNPRPADYEKPGPALRTRYLHGYHGVVPPMTLIAPLAQVARSTNRSTVKR